MQRHVVDRFAESAAGHPGLDPPVPSPKRKGGVRKVLGVLLVGFGVLPLLGAGAVAAKAVSNSQQQLVNDAFVPKAWHNLPADQFFPDRFGVSTFGDGGKVEFHAWARQGIDDASSCEDPGLEPELADAVNEHGCRAVVRATYVDPSATLVATIAVSVVGSDSDAVSIAERFDPSLTEYEGQFARAFPVTGTPAEEWTDEARAGVAFDTHGPYVQALTVGYVDGRSVGVLPEPWTSPAPGSANEDALDDIARAAGNSYWDHVMHVSIKEKTR